MSSSVAVRRLTPAGARSLLQGVKYVMLDIDGVIWAGDHVIDGIPETLRWLQDDLNISVRFMTNNSTKTRMDTVDKFHGKGMMWVNEDLVMSSAFASTVQLLKHGDTTGDTINMPQSSSSAPIRVYNRNVLVLGDAGLHKEIRSVLHPSKTTYGFEMVHPSLLAHLYNSTNNTDAEKKKKEELGKLSFTNVPYSPAVVLHALDHPVVPIGGVTTTPSDGGALLYTRAPLGSMEQLISIGDLDVGAIISGLDPHLNYHKVSAAGLILQVDKARREKEGNTTPPTAPRIPWIQTNPDPELPMKYQSNCTSSSSDAATSTMFFLPGSGTTESLLSTYLCRPPDKVCGKPHPDMAFALFDKIQSEQKVASGGGEESTPSIINPEVEVLMVGDRVSTDIVFGRRAGCKTLMVLSGCEDEGHVEAAGPEHRPHFVAASLAELKTLFQAVE